jgi:Rieske Fe-S protein
MTQTSPRAQTAPATSSQPLADDVASDTTLPGVLSRRAVVAGVGGVACAGLLTACGGSTATAPATPAAPAPSAAEPEPSEDDSAADDSADDDESDELAATSDIPVGGGTVFADDDVVVTQPTAGEFKAFSATCTHQGCKVNAVTNGQIACPCHGSRFSVADGSVVAGPAKKPLPAKSVTVDGDSIVLA